MLNKHFLQTTYVKTLGAWLIMCFQIIHICLALLCLKAAISIFSFHTVKGIMRGNGNILNNY